MAGQPRSPAAPLPGPSRPSRALPSPSHHPQPHFQPHPHPYQHQLQQQQHTHTQPQPPTRRSAIPSFSRPQQPLGGGGAGWSTSRDALDLPGLSGGEDDGDDDQVGDSDGWTSDDEDEGFGSFAGKGAGGLLGRGRKDPFGAASGHARSSIGISGASDPSAISHASTAALRTFKHSPMVQHPTEDYLEFEETHGEGMRRAKRLLAFLSEDVVGALLPQIETLETRAVKSCQTLEQERDKLIGAEAAARQARAAHLTSHLSVLSTSILSNRLKLRQDLEAMAEDTRVTLGGLKEEFERERRKIEGGGTGGGGGGGAGKGGAREGGRKR